MQKLEIVGHNVYTNVNMRLSIEKVDDSVAFMSTSIPSNTYGGYGATCFGGAVITEHKDGTVSIRMRADDLRSMANSAAHGEATFAKDFARSGIDPAMPEFNRACEASWQAIHDALNEMLRGPGSSRYESVSG